MFDKLNSIFPKSKDWSGMSGYVGMCGQLLNYFEQHKEKEGEEAKIAAIDPVIELLNAATATR